MNDNPAINGVVVTATVPAEKNPHGANRRARRKLAAEKRQAGRRAARFARRLKAAAGQLRPGDGTSTRGQ